MGSVSTPARIPHADAASGRTGTRENPEFHDNVPGQVSPILEREFDDLAAAPHATGDLARVSAAIDCDIGQICALADAPVVARERDATICWTSDRPLRPGDRLSITHTTRTARAIVVELIKRVDVDTVAPETGVDAFTLNDIDRVRLRTSAPLMREAYRTNRATGGFILIDDTDSGTVSAGMINAAPEGRLHREADLHDVAFLNNVVLAFHADLCRLAGLRE